GLDSARGVTASPDGRNVYVAGYNDNAVAWFSRDPHTGELTYAGRLVGGSENNEPKLNHPFEVVVSPDGTYVYVAASDDNAISVFTRGTEAGELTYLGSTSSTALKGVRSLVVSEEGGMVYAVSYNGDALVSLSVQPDGSLVQETVIVNGDDDNVTGLDGARDIALSPDGKNLYVASWVSNAVAWFKLEDGQPIFAGSLQDGVDGLDGLAMATSVAVSDKHVYVAGNGDNAIVVFARDEDGNLTHVTTLFDGEGGLSGLAAVRD